MTFTRKYWLSDKHAMNTTTVIRELSRICTNVRTRTVIFLSFLLYEYTYGLLSLVLTADVMVNSTAQWSINGQVDY